MERDIGRCARAVDALRFYNFRDARLTASAEDQLRGHQRLVLVPADLRFGLRTVDRPAHTGWLERRLFGVGRRARMPAIRPRRGS
jgi:hypothetical protein